MAKKKAKVANRTKAEKKAGPVERWSVFDAEDDYQVYGGKGIAKADAERLAAALVRPAVVRQVG